MDGDPTPDAPGVARHLVPALLAWVVGVGAQLQQAQLWPTFAYAGLLVAAAGLGWSARSVRRRPWAWLPGALIPLALALLAYGSTGLRAAQRLQHALVPVLEGRDLAVVGVVQAMPDRRDDGLRLRLGVEQATLEGQPVVLPPVLDLGWYERRLAPDEDDETTAPPLRERPQAGERWAMTVRLKAPHGHSNPHGHDHELWLWTQGLQASGYVRRGPRDPPPQRLGQTARYPVEELRQQARDAILARLDDGLDEAHARRAGIIAALVVGDQPAIDRADWAVFRATGVAHLMSISGLHITMFAWLAMQGVGWLWRRSPGWCLRWPAPQVGRLGGMLLALAYAVFSGWGVPAQRTVCMLAVVGLLGLGARRWPWPVVWLLAMAAVTAYDPWSLLQPGFWLSFVAVGVLFATGSRDPPRSPGAASWWAAAHARVREQGLITLALAPLTLLLFGEVSLVSLLANLVAIPVVTLLVTPLSLLGLLWPLLWLPAAWCVQMLTDGLGVLATWPWAVLARPQAPVWLSLAGVGGACLLALRLPWCWRVQGVPVLLALLLWSPPRPAPGQFELLAPDIGQGNAVLLRTAGHALLYDAGARYSEDSDAGSRVLVPLLRALGVSLDMLVLSHRDSDHTGGAAAVGMRHPQVQVLASFEAADVSQRVDPTVRCVAGQRWDWDGVRFEVLSPLPQDYASARRANALSCVLRVSNGRHAVLLSGDIERAQELRLQTAALAVRADVLLVPHHGSKTSSSASFIHAVAPRYALVQAGYRNRFGHPAADVVARYRAARVLMLESASCGAMQWHTARPEAVGCHRQQALRYWHHRPPLNSG